MELWTNKKVQNKRAIIANFATKFVRSNNLHSISMQELE